jgi:hypothetical protein
MATATGTADGTDGACAAPGLASSSVGASQPAVRSRTATATDDGWRVTETTSPRDASRDPRTADNDDDDDDDDELTDADLAAVEAAERDAALTAGGDHAASSLPGGIVTPMDVDVPDAASHVVPEHAAATATDDDDSNDDDAAHAMRAMRVLPSVDDADADTQTSDNAEGDTKQASQAAGMNAQSSEDTGACASSSSSSLPPASPSKLKTRELPRGIHPREPRPPLWLRSSQAWSARGQVAAKRLRTKASEIDVEVFKKRQLETLELFRKVATHSAWKQLHNGHFDWWMFPIEDGSREMYNVVTQVCLFVCLHTHTHTHKHTHTRARAHLLTLPF